MEQNYFQTRPQLPRTSTSHTLPPTNLIPKSPASIRQCSQRAENPLTAGYENTLIEDEDSIYEIDPECIQCKKNHI